MSVFSRLIDIIYPPRCPVCGEFLCKESPGPENKDLCFCRTCSADFHEITSPICPICGSPFMSGTGKDHTCEECLRNRPFYEASAAPYLYEGALMTAVHQFKYGEKTFLSDYLGPILSQFAETWIKESGNILTMPVPLHPKRLRERGYNQSLLLARHVAAELDTELDFLSLRRVKYTLSQTGLGKEERRKNVRRAFRLVNPDAVKGKTVLLIDDVATTGNTLNECSRMLVRSDCKKVLCLTLARTPKG